VCPWNVRFSQVLTEPAFQSRNFLHGKNARTLAKELLVLSQAEFSAAFRNSPMKRAKRRGLARNAAVVLGNLANTEDVEVLVTALTHDEPLVREHAAWALGRIDSPLAVRALRATMPGEPDANVRAELVAALRTLEQRSDLMSK